MGDFHIILNGHLNGNTRPPGEAPLSDRRQQFWMKGEFARACGVADGTVGFWLDGRSNPTKAAMARIENVLFGKDQFNDTPEYAAWRRELRAAYEIAKKTRRGRDDGTEGADGGSEAAEERIGGKRSQENDRVAIEPTPNVAEAFKLLVRVPPLFLGREQLLTQVAAQLKPASGCVTPVILFGMRGVGKTTLAAAYADAHRADYRVIWSIRAESAASICNGLRDLCQCLGWPFGGGDPEIAAQPVLDRLPREDHGILLIFDNAESSKSVARFLPRGGECHVIITSNSHAWRGVGTPIEVNIWPTEIGAKFLIERAGQRSESFAAEKLSVALEGLPLAHEVAAAFCEHTSVTIGDYLRTLTDNPIKLLHDQRYSPVDYYGGIAVARAFEMSIETAARLHPACAVLMAYAACLPPGPIPHCIFTLGLQHTGSKLRGTPFTKDDLVDALAVLRNFALIKYSTIFSAHIPGRAGRIPQEVEIHRLVRIISADYAIRSGIITQSPEENVEELIDAALCKCDLRGPLYGPEDNYTILFGYLLHLMANGFAKSKVVTFENLYRGPTKGAQSNL